MSQNTSKKGFGFYVVLLAAVLALAAGVYFLVIHGTFGLDSTHNGNCYDPLITCLLIGGAAVAVGLARPQALRSRFCGHRHCARRRPVPVRAQVLLVCGRCLRRHR